MGRALNHVSNRDTMVLNMATSDPIELLFGKYRRELLALLLLRPDENFYVRELERLSGIPAGSLHRELISLADAGLVRRISLGNQVRYQANRDSPYFDDLASLFRKAAAMVDAPGQKRSEVKEPAPASYTAVPAKAGPLRRLAVSKKVITDLCRKWKIQKFSFFGSVTRDDFRPDSDVDVLVEFRRGDTPSLFGIVDLREELATVFGRSVDVATPAIFGNPVRRRTIERDLQCIYEA